MQSGSGRIWRFHFIVTGRVQGVFFRKFTKQKADELGITGWCRNTRDRESVEGEIEGTEIRIHEMMDWIREKGSPHAVIEHAAFDSISEGDDRVYNSFDIRR